MRKFPKNLFLLLAKIFYENFREIFTKMRTKNWMDSTITFRAQEKDFFSIICLLILQFLINVRTALDSRNWTVSIGFIGQDIYDRAHRTAAGEIEWGTRMLGQDSWTGQPDETVGMVNAGQEREDWMART